MKKKYLLKMINDGFIKAKEQGLLSGTTANSYFERVQTFVNQKIAKKVEETRNEKLYNPKYWKGSWMDDYVEEMVDDYHYDIITAGTIEGRIHAVHKLAELVKTQKIFGKGIDKIRVGLKGSVKKGEGQLNRLHQEGVVDSRHHVTSIKPKGGELELIKEAIPKTNRNYATIIKVLDAQSHTGGRIKAELKLQVGNIDYNNQLKKYINDKNSFNRNIPIDDMYVDFYKELEKGKNKGAPLFPIYNHLGKQMSADKASLYVQEVLHRAAEKAGVNYEGEIVKKDKGGNEKTVPVEMRYTSHSTRRRYGQKEYDKTRYWSKNKLEKEIGKYLNLQGSNKEKIIERIENERIRLNHYNIKHGKPMRKFHWEELRRLSVSLKLGHSRLDVVARYVDLDDSAWKRKK
ncbi:hypothetical protein [Psychrobacillus sp. MER TA 171]|uniref:hypothetical protein n=1 Tax=Psychrobacillus sp. MER TA 171 TaxID=2939577 RepID=UPI00203F3474|nr:hypothetical protein [Psychrobacillus sp. MER TA 171]MCM3358669.1 hypothetical protein [Psychrobacillus sp. MER TA 171]